MDLLREHFSSVVPSPSLESLILSILALFIAIPLYEAKENLGLHRFLDGFIFVAIGGLVVTLLVPEALEVAGWWALPIFFAGFLLPSLSESLFVKSTKPLHASALILGMFAFGLHILADGAALATHSHGHSQFPTALAAQVAAAGQNHSHQGLELGVILHRLPIGLAIWWFVRPQYGVIAALGVLGLISLGTVAGFIFAPTAMALLSSESIALFQAFVAGTLMHVIFHSKPETPTENIGRKWWEGVGNLLGAAFVVYIFISHTEAQHQVVNSWFTQFSNSLIALTLESAPALVLAFFAAALAATFLPASYFSWMSRGSRLQQTSKGIAVGLPIPVCSCGVVPLYHTLIRKGVPPSAATAFLVATPELGIDAILLSLPLLGETMTAVRVLAAIILALVVGLVIGRLIDSTTTNIEGHDHDHAAEGNTLSRFRHSLIEIVDHTYPWILAGLLIAAALDPVIQRGGFAWIPAGFEIPFFALLGMPMYVCASGATPFVAVLLLGGVSPGAAIAFLLTGPATNVTTFGVLQQLHGKRIALLFALCTFTVAIGLGYLTNLVLPEFEPISMTKDEHSWSLLNSVAMLLLAALLLDSLLRCGARAFLGELNPGKNSTHDHSHHHSHQH